MVIAAFSLFTLYNDLPATECDPGRPGELPEEMGNVTAGNIQNWLSGRILMVENLAQNIASTPSRMP